MAHLYASFADAAMAEKAAGALLDYGVRQEDISLVANDQYGQTRESYTAQTADPAYAVGATGYRGRNGRDWPPAGSGPISISLGTCMGRHPLTQMNV